ncbi:glycosyltransferase [Gordonia sp. CPCC 205515]|uniref:glycosyltransferase n=1 Tax=Gordonia sp. CPCC 205515 TaxID=3140791 RepID=UPI003AF38B9E
MSPDGAYGGPASVALNLCAELDRRGHDVLLAAGTWGYNPVPTEVDGVRVQLFDAHRLIPVKSFAGVGAPGLWRWFRRFGREFDVVHVHFGRDLVVAPVAWAARFRGVPYVLQTHGMVIPSRHPLARPVDAVMTRPVLRGAGAVCCLDDLERAQVREVGGRGVNLQTLPNGVPDYTGPVVPPGGTPEVLFASRLHARKRPLVFVDMAHRLLATGVDARFTLVGPDNGEADTVGEAIADETRITWEGPLDHTEIPQRMSQARVFVLPSVAEPYPMAVLEAMSVGIPVVVTDDCGLAPLVERVGCGVVVDHSADSLATAVGGILAEPAKGVHMGQRGRAAVHTECGMAAIADRLDDIYARLVDR